MGFLRKMTGNTAKRQRDGTWISASVESVIKEAGTKTLEVYIHKRKETVVEWVVLMPILEVCNMGTGYEGGGRRCDLWWRQMTPRKNLSATLEDILAAERARRQESGRRGNGGGVGEVSESDSGIKVTWYCTCQQGI